MYKYPTLLILFLATIAYGSTYKYPQTVPSTLKDTNMKYSTDSSFTLQAWIKPEKLDSTGKFSAEAPHMVLCKGSVRNGDFNYALRIQACRLELMLHSDRMTIASMKRKIPVGKWVHLSVIYDASKGLVTFFVNGGDKAKGGVKEVIKVGPLKKLKTNNLSLSVGADGIVKSRPYRSFPGQIDDVKFSRKILTSGQLSFPTSYKKYSPLGGIYMIGDWESGDIVRENASKKDIVTTNPYTDFQFKDVQEIKFDPAKKADFFKFEFDAGKTDRFGQPERHLGIVIKYRDSLDRTATLRSWMGYFGDTPEQSPWSKLVYPQNLLGFIGGLEDGKERECYVVIERTPLMRVQEKEGKLHFRIDSHKPFLLRSIKLFTVSDQELENWKKAKRKAVFDLYGFKFAKVSRTGNFTQSTPNTIDGIKLFETSTQQTLYPELSAYGKDLNKLDLAACPGQFQPASFGICPEQDVSNFQVKLSDLKSENRDVIKSSNISATIARIIVSSEASFLRPGTYAKLIPYNLVPIEYAGTLFAGQPRWVWLTIHVPDNARPGLYRGNAAISVAGKKIREIPLTLRVWPFKLESPKMQFSMYPSSLPLIGNDMILEKALLDMKQHGMSGFCVGGIWAPKVIKDAGGPKGYRMDFSQTDRIMGLLRKYQLDKHVIFNFDFLGQARKMIGVKSSEVEIEKIAEDIFADTMAHAKMKKWPQLLWFTLDEPSEPHRQAMTRKTYDIIKKYPENQTYTTCQALSVRNALGPKLDYPCMSVGFETVRLEELEKIRKADPDAKFAMYDQFWGDKALYQRAKMWWYWGTDMPEKTILTWWAYLAIREAFYDNLTHRIGNWRGLLNMVAHSAGVSPARDGVIGNVVWQNIRLGIDDMRYLQTFEKTLKSVEKLAPQHQTVKKARSFLKRLKGEFGVPAKKFVDENIREAYPDYVFDSAHRSWPTFRVNEDYDYDNFKNLRNQTAKHIVALNKLKNNKK